MPTETSGMSNLLFSLSTRPVDVDDDLFSRGRKAEPIRWTAPPPPPVPAPLPPERAPRATRAPDLRARPSHPALRSAKRDRIWPLFLALVIAGGGGIAGARYLTMDDDATIPVSASAFSPPKVEAPPPAPVVEPIAAAPAAAPVAAEEPKPAEAPAEATPAAPAVAPLAAKKAKKHAAHAKKHVAAAHAKKAKKADAPIAPVIKDDDDEPAAAPPPPEPKPSRPQHQADDGENPL